MRTIAPILFAMTISACGSEQSAENAGDSTTQTKQRECGAEPAAGYEWTENDGSKLKLNSDCSGTDSACGASFFWTPEVDHTTTVDVTYTKGGANCPSMGKHSCQVFYTPKDPPFDEVLLIKCNGYPWRNYVRN